MSKRCGDMPAVALLLIYHCVFLDVLDETHAQYWCCHTYFLVQLQGHARGNAPTTNGFHRRSSSAMSAASSAASADRYVACTVAEKVVAAC